MVESIYCWEYHNAPPRMYIIISGVMWISDIVFEKNARLSSFLIYLPKFDMGREWCLVCYWYFSVGPLPVPLHYKERALDVFFCYFYNIFFFYFLGLCWSTMCFFFSNNPRTFKYTDLDIDSLSLTSQIFIVLAITTTDVFLSIYRGKFSGRCHAKYLSYALYAHATILSSFYPHSRNVTSTRCWLQLS